MRGAVSGDIVRAGIIKVNKSYYVARLIEILTPSPYRIGEGVCRAPESCGGCVYRHISYEYELTLKRELVKNAFHRAARQNIRKHIACADRRKLIRIADKNQNAVVANG